MCGIAGFVSGDRDKQAIDLMLVMLAHRGPDEFGTYVDPNIALGCARLSIVDVENGTQPIRDPTTGVVIVFNGEIYNLDELRVKLRNKGYSFNTRSDTEVVLNLYIEYGRTCLEYLNGQFAVGIWDPRERRLFLARDRFGIRPLFYFHSGPFFAFASEIKSLLVHQCIPRRFNHRALDQLYTFWTPIADSTFLEGIHEVGPGTFLALQSGVLRKERYWEWPFPQLHQVERGSREEESEEFAERLTRAISLRLRADVEVGAYLSGGIDSSAIVAVASNMQNRALRTYSIAFNEKSYDEREHQDLVAKHCQTNHTAFCCDYADIEVHFEKVIWHTEAPIFRTAPTPLFMLSNAVHNDGIKVVLTGEGADEILLGYDLFRELRIRRFWGRQPSSRSRPLLFKRLYQYLPQFSDERYVNFAIDSYRPTLDVKSEYYSHCMRWGGNAANKVYFSEDSRRTLRHYDAEAELEATLPNTFFDVADLDRAQYLELHTLLKGYLLSSQGDRMSMAHSVEGRYPFLDHQFVEYVNSLPQSYKLAGLKDKSILRSAMTAHLPESIRQRPKTAYQAPEIAPFLHGDEHSPMVDQYLSDSSITDRGIFDVAAKKRLMAKIKLSHQVRHSARDNMAFVQLLSTQVFCDLFLNADFLDASKSALKQLSVPFKRRIWHDVEPAW